MDSADAAANEADLLLAESDEGRAGQVELHVNIGIELEFDSALGAGHRDAVDPATRKEDVSSGPEVVLGVDRLHHHGHSRRAAADGQWLDDRLC
jgi:hypothetical protein